MKKITKQEALWLDEHGFYMGERVFPTKHKYYCTEDERVLNALVILRSQDKDSAKEVR